MTFKPDIWSSKLPNISSTRALKNDSTTWLIFAKSFQRRRNRGSYKRDVPWDWRSAVCHSTRAIVVITLPNGDDVAGIVVTEISLQASFELPHCSRHMNFDCRLTHKGSSQECTNITFRFPVDEDGSCLYTF